MREFQSLKNRVENLEKENLQLKEATDHKMELFSSKIQDVEENAILAGKMNGSLRDLLKGDKS
jgi:hypothetical protein